MVLSLVRFFPLYLMVASFLGRQRATGEFLGGPSIRWGRNLEGSFRKGNAIVSSDDGNQLFVTSSDGGLHFVPANLPNEESTKFSPPATGQTMICRSSVAQVKGVNGTLEYLVYAVIDSGRKSRVLAVNLDATLLWSLDVDGVIAGTPLVSDTSGLIYLSRNVLGEEGNQGFLSVVEVVNNTAPEIIASVSAETGAPFSPPSISTMGTGDSPEGGQDFIAVGEAWENGFADEGSIYLLTPSDQFEALEGRGSDSYNLRLASSFPFAIVVAPTTSNNSPHMYVAAQSSTIAGWTENRELQRVIEGRREDADPTWVSRVRPNNDNFDQPLLSSVVVNSDESLLYVSGTVTDLFCVDASNGDIVWSDLDGESSISMKPKLWESEQGVVVYSIESLRGKVRAHDAENGDRLWEFSCEDITNSTDCQGSVEAEFSISSSGNLLYYVDVSGRMLAIEVAAFETDAPTGTPSSAPSFSPSSFPSMSSSPTVVSSESPTVFTASPSPPPTMSQGMVPSISISIPPTTISPIFLDTNAARNQGSGDDDSVKDKLPIILGVICGSLLVVAMILFIVGRKRKKDEETQEIVVIEDIADDLEGDNESMGDGDGDDDDSAVAIEVVGGSAVYSPKKRKPKKKKQQEVSPSGGARSLAAIEEVPEVNDDNTVVVTGDEDDDGDSVKNLNDKFAYVVEAQTEAESTPPNSPSRNGALTILGSTSPKSDYSDAEDIDGRDPLRSKSPSNSSMGSSTIYLDNDDPRAKSVTPTPTHLISEKDVDAPDDEAGMLLMTQPWLDGKEDPPNLSRTRLDRSTEDGPVVAPGTHYMNKEKLANKDPAPKHTSGRFGTSARQKKQPSSAFGSSPKRSNEWKPADSNISSPEKSKSAGPSFKRRSKRSFEGEPPNDKPQEAKIEKQADAWNDFLKDLEAAEQQFFAPKARPSPLLSYYDSDSETDDVPPHPSDGRKLLDE